MSPQRLRFYDFLLKLYPLDFRDDYGREMRAMVRARWREEGQARGFIGLALLSTALVWDTVLSSLQEHLSMLLQDIRYTFRALRNAPMFALGVILTAALGIGANTAIFSVVDHVLLRPLPFPNAGRLLRVRLTHPTQHDVSMSMADFIDWRSQNRTFPILSAYTDEVFTLTGVESPRMLQGAKVTDQFFETLGVGAAMGRAFHRGDGGPGAARSVVLSHTLWRQLFDRRDALGQSLKLDSLPYTIVGVMPAGFVFPSEDSLLWVIQPTPTPRRRGPYHFIGIARMSSGASFDQARSQLNSTIFPVTALSGRSESTPINFYVQPLQEAMVGHLRQSLLILLGGVALVLLIACVNVANLLLARSGARDREVALRLALGANAYRLFRQFLTESIVLATMGALAGLGLAYAAMLWCRNAAQGYLPRLETVSLDGRVLLFTAGATLLAGILFGLAPALRAIRPRMKDALGSGRAAHGGIPGKHLRWTLIFGEVMLACMLVIGAGLLVRSLLRLTSVSPGVRTDHLLTLELALPETRYRDAGPTHRFFAKLIEDVARIPGVESASASSGLPPDQNFIGEEYTFDTNPLNPGDPLPVAPMVIATPGYFSTLGIPVLQGRAFAETDGPDAPPVAIISRAMAQRYFLGGDPIGRRIRQGGVERGNAWREIVGVVADAKYEGLSAPDIPVFYEPEAQNSLNGMLVTIRSSLPEQTMLRGVRQIIYQMDKDLAIDHPRTMEEVLARSISLPALRATLLAMVAALALLLASVGIYGVVAFSVSQRSSEIAVRTALGAQRPALLWMVIRQSMQPVVCGIAAGLAASAALARTTESLLYGIDARNPLTFATATALLGIIALLASSVPAMRAAAIDPAITLRSE